MSRSSAPESGASMAVTDASYLMPVTAQVKLDAFDPVAAFRQISADGQGFILDGSSPEPGADRFVFVGAGDCDRLLTDPGTTAGDVNPVVALRELLDGLQVEDQSPGIDVPMLSGAIGYVGYEAVRHFEPSVGDLPEVPVGLPESAFFLPDRFLVFDREKRVLTAVVLIEADAGLVAETDARTSANRLLEAASGTVSSVSALEGSERSKSLATIRDLTSKTRYEEIVRRAKCEIERGELIQVVLSQRAVRRTQASPLDVYAALAELNPSPYMFMLNFGDFSLVGSSPELMVRSQGRQVSMHPIAGTRPRGAKPEEDAAFEAELLTSEKECAEHVMLVDLARNDLGRVSEAGSVEVESFMATERYSHVMHLVSRVKGILKPGADGIDAFVAGFPLGTLTGAPRLRSVELIAELEKEGRGPYCGGIGWFSASGDVNTGTVIRCVTMKDGIAHVQGGAGIVFDSDPEREYLESVQKMAAQFDAIEMAERPRLSAAMRGPDAATD